MSKNFHIVLDAERRKTIIYHLPSGQIKVGNSLMPELQNENDAYFNELFHNKLSSDLVISEHVYQEKPIGLTFMAARSCNLGCTYCFAGEGEYGCIDTKPKGIKAEEYVKSLEFSLEHSPKGVESISFFGGEPLLYYKEIEKFLNQIDGICEKYNTAVPMMSVCTNGVLLNDVKISVLKKHNVKVVISLDGPEELNDKARVMKKSLKGTYNLIKRTAVKLKNQNMDYAIQMTLNKNHLLAYDAGEAIKWVSELDALGPNIISIIPVESDHPELGIKTEEELNILDEISRELTKYYLNKVLEGNDIAAKGLIAPIIQLSNNEYVKVCGAGRSYFVDSDLKAYPCQMFCNDDSAQIGDINNNSFDGEKGISIANIRREDSKFCQECINRKVCTVWCKGLQTMLTGDYYETLDPRCTFSRANLEECIKFLAKIESDAELKRGFWDNMNKIHERRVPVGG